MPLLAGWKKQNVLFPEPSGKLWGDLSDLAIEFKSVFPEAPPQNYLPYLLQAL